MHKDLKRRIFITVLSLFLSLFFSEKLVDSFLPQKTYSRAYKVANDCFQKSDFTVFSLKPNCKMPIQDFDTGERFTTMINSLGYRGQDFSLEKKAGEKRILIAGDSFILGYGVKDRDLVTAYTEDKLKNSNVVSRLKDAKVINAGYTGGFGPDGYFLHLKNFDLKLQPDLVVFSVFVYNDFSDMADNEWYGIGEFGEPTKVVSKTITVSPEGWLLPTTIPGRYRLPVLRESNLVILAAETGSRMYSWAKHTFDVLKFKIFKPIFPTGEAKDSNLPGAFVSRCLFGELCHRQTMHLYEDLNSVIKASYKLVSDPEKGSTSRFVVLIIPAEFQIYPDTWEKYKTDDGISKELVYEENPNPQKRLKEMLSAENIPYIDLLPIMRAQKERIYFENDGHWNAKGHEVAAEAIYQWILRNYQ